MTKRMQTKIERAQYAAIELRMIEVVKENHATNHFMQRQMIDSDVACRMMVYSYSGSELCEILRDMSRLVRINFGWENYDY